VRFLCLPNSFKAFAGLLCRYLFKQGILRERQSSCVSFHQGCQRYDAFDRIVLPSICMMARSLKECHVADCRMVQLQQTLVIRDLHPTERRAHISVAAVWRCGVLGPPISGRAGFLRLVPRLWGPAADQAACPCGRQYTAGTLWTLVFWPRDSP
jgi:hypothetical protein